MFYGFLLLKVFPTLFFHKQGNFIQVVTLIIFDEQFLELRNRFFGYNQNSLSFWNRKFYRGHFDNKTSWFVPYKFSHNYICLSNSNFLRAYTQKNTVILRGIGLRGITILPTRSRGIQQRYTGIYEHSKSVVKYGQ